MERYNLDNLGWYQFEMLIQSLLKSKCGLNLESWGKSGDFGRDAFSKNPIKFPFESENEGPFIFQMKFVENANAAGANPTKALFYSVHSEIKKIQKRKTNKLWVEPNFFTLISNTHMSKTLREEIRGIIAEELPNTNITLWGSTDVSDLLDQHPNIRRSFPQLLSLKELDFLLERALGKQVRERSVSAIEEARNIIPVFVPTSAYRKCWELVSKNHFAVLDGPPEVGKTAIALMVAISLFEQNWETILCNSSEDFFTMYQTESTQIFIADDAFGRTEYDVTRGRMWEKDLNKVLTRLDNKHLLIWTSRRHILENALRDMDLQGKAINFPNPSEVIIDAGQLTTEEKALILYRHAKAANLEIESKIIVKNNASRITKNPYFTPERIRLFVDQVLPELVDLFKKGELSEQRVSEEIQNAISRPTERMRKTFQKLSLPHKYVLLSLLKESGEITTEKIKRNFDECFFEYQQDNEFNSLLEDLSESFIHIKNESIKK